MASDITKAELNYVIDDVIKYLKNNRNHLSQDLYRQMNRDDYLGKFGHIYCHNNRFDVDIKLTRIKNGE